MSKTNNYNLGFSAGALLSDAFDAVVMNTEDLKSII